MPKVWNKQDPACPEDAVYIGRPTKWGNPYTHLNKGSLAKFRTTNREEAVKSYKHWLWSSPELLKAIPELRGKDLVCWCKPAICHGDILLELANRETISDKCTICHKKWVNTEDGFDTCQPCLRSM